MHAGARYGVRLPSLISVPMGWADAVQMTVNDFPQHQIGNGVQWECQPLFVVSTTQCKRFVVPWFQLVVSDRSYSLILRLRCSVTVVAFMPQHRCWGIADHADNLPEPANSANPRRAIDGIQ